MNDGELKTRLDSLESEVKVLKEKLNSLAPAEDNVSMVLFSGDLDKVLAAFIIATGAAGMGAKVSMFFTFWALAAIRNPKSKKVDKDIIGKMMGSMLPNGAANLKLSKMNMMGLGTKMIKSIMKKNKVLSLEELIKYAVDMEINITICEMSKNLMGFKNEEFLPELKFTEAGVASFVDQALKSKVTLFI